MKSNKNIAIELTGVTKKYLVHHEKPTFAERILKGKDKEFTAIKDLSFSINIGERVGIIGPNGSGKTTLLKLMAGIANPTKGNIKTFGKIISLIDLEAGFHPDLTGIQNISLNGMLIGMTKSEIKKKMKDIISFANIGQFIDTQLFTYSEGMKLRLGFAISVYADPDILILDESMSVGDESFRKQSNNKIDELFGTTKTIIVASHDLYYISKHCNRVIIINEGKIIEDGAPKTVIDKYLKMYDLGKI